MLVFCASLQSVIIIRFLPLIDHQFAKEIYPGQFEPSLGHMFIKELENHGKLLRNFTQNIDTIELTAGIRSSPKLRLHYRRRTNYVQLFTESIHCCMMLATDLPSKTHVLIS